MADVYTGKADLNFAQTAWNRLVYKALRPKLFFDRFATVKGSTYHPGETVSFVLWADLTAATTPLGEATDVDARVMDTSTVSVTINEYGDAVIPTALARATAFTNIDADVADIIAQSASLTLDTLARVPANSGTNIRYASASAETRPTSPQQVEEDDLMLDDDVRYVVAQMRTANVREFDGNAYAGIIHPHVSYDFRDGAAGRTDWSDPVNYSEPDRRWNGEIGKFESVRFMESPRALVSTDTGSPSTVDAYHTVIFGQEAIAKAFSSGGNYSGGAGPTFVVSDKADNLDRFRAIGWKWLGGYGIFREAALWRIVSGSSIGTNA